MPRPSPKTDRVVAVLELLADRGGVGATLTEISDGIGVNRPSCVHVLAALEVAGVVVREDDRRYHLGPALVRPGEVAAARYPLLARARPTMTDLAQETGLPCFAFAPDGDHARLVHHTWPHGRPPTPVRTGERLPLGPPLGLVFAAWADDAGFAAWLARAPELTGPDVVALTAQRDAVRALGFVVELAPSPSEAHDLDLADVLEDRSSPFRDRRLHRLLSPTGSDTVLTDLEQVGDRPVIAIGAPVRDRTGAVVLGLSLVVYPEPLPASAIGSIGATVRSAADRLSATLA